MKKKLETLVFVVLGMVYVIFSWIVIWYLINLIFFNFENALVSIYIVLGVSLIALIFGVFSLKALTKKFLSYSSKLKEPEIERLNNLFTEVAAKSARKNVKLLLFNDTKNEFLGSPALALQTSKSYIGISEVVRREDDEVIKGLIAHEMYHIISNFNFVYFFVNILSMVFSIIFLVLLQIFQSIMKVLNRKKLNSIIYVILYIFYIITAVLLLIIRLPYNILIAPLNRYEEKQADKFACSLGYAEGLRYGLFKTTKDAKITIKHIFYWILPIHPLVDQRLDRIYELSEKTYGKEFYIINDQLYYIETDNERIIIPDNAVKIANNKILKHTNKVKYIDFNNVIEVSSNAFRNSHSLEEVDLSNVQIIKQYAFLNCSKLGKVIISNSLVEIEESAFKDTLITKDKEIDFIKLNNWAIACNIKNPKYLEIPTDITNIQNNLFRTFTKLEFIRILNLNFKLKEEYFVLPRLKAIIWETKENLDNVGLRIIKSLDEFKKYIVEELKILELSEEEILEINRIDNYKGMIDKYNDCILRKDLSL